MLLAGCSRLRLAAERAQAPRSRRVTIELLPRIFRHSVFSDSDFCGLPPSVLPVCLMQYFRFRCYCAPGLRARQRREDREMDTAAQRRRSCLQRERERGSALRLYAMIAALVYIGAATPPLRSPRYRCSSACVGTLNASPPCVEDELSLGVHARSAAKTRLTQVASPRLSADGPFLGLPLAPAQQPQSPSHIPLPLAPLTRGPASEQELFTPCPINSDFPVLTIPDAAVSLACPISPTVALKPPYTSRAGFGRHLGRWRQPRARARKSVRGSTRQCTWRRRTGRMRS